MAEPAFKQVGQHVRVERVALLGYRSNPYSGGQGIYLKYLSAALAGNGLEVDVISGEPYPELDERVNLIKLPGLNLFAAENHLTALRPQHLLSATDFFEWLSMASGGFPEPYTFGRRVVRHLSGQASRYDLVHDNQCLSYGTLRLQQKGLPLVTTIHHPITWDRDIALEHAERWGDRLLIRRWHHFLTMQRRVARKLEQIVTVSQRSREDICAAFDIDPENVRVVYNGIDAEAFRPNPEIRREAETLITTASADQPLKGTQHLIPAFARLKSAHPNARLIFIGKPKPGGPTESLIRRHELSDAIQFVHGITTEEIRDLYARSTLAVVPSEYEGFGLPAGEAMACGVPVVSTDGGALPEVVGDAGVVVPAGDPDALANAMIRLLADPEERARLGPRGRKRVLEHFSWEKAACEMTEVYRDVLERHASRGPQ